MTDFWIQDPNGRWMRADPCAAAAAFDAGWRVQLGIFGDLELELLDYDPETSAESPKVGGCCDAPKE